jgi:hypothetical protein
LPGRPIALQQPEQLDDFGGSGVTDLEDLRYRLLRLWHIKLGTIVSMRIRFSTVSMTRRFLCSHRALT